MKITWGNSADVGTADVGSDLWAVAYASFALTDMGEATLHVSCRCTLYYVYIILAREQHAPCLPHRRLCTKVDSFKLPLS